MNILVIQSTEIDPIGILGEHLEALGAQLQTWSIEKQTEPPPGEYAGLIVLGGPMNAHEDNKFPHLKQTVDLIQQFHHDNKPIMGVCLGAQLIARAFGSQVYPHTVPELGFARINVAQTPPLASPLDRPPLDRPPLDRPPLETWLESYPSDLKLMQWHFDTFDLPKEATLLMTNEVCQNQAFRIGQNIYGFQFHLEVTPEIVMNWLQMKDAWIEAHYPRLDQQLREQTQRYSAQSAQFTKQVAQAWLNLASTPALST